MPNAKLTLTASAIALILACATGGIISLTAPGGAVQSDTTLSPPALGGGRPSLDIGAARHVLDRFGFGPRPGEAEALASDGLTPWLDRQLEARPPAQPELDAALAPHRHALVPASELVDRWLGPDAVEIPSMGGELNRRIQPYFREHLAHLVLAQLTRHTLSHQQLREVMVDFWSNHFNVFAPKGLVRVFVGDYVEQVIRPLALGRFEDLLIATARHPAMLIYLDNAQSSAKRGLNENYARELLELHTVGVNGGYAQADVVDVARILTGWSVARPGQARGEPFEFVFRPGQHDRGAKHVLGQAFAEGGAEEEGLRLLSFLATHPATARHLATKLCARFVADEPPPSCVSAAEEAYVESGGSMPAVLTAIVHEPSFWSEGVRARKLKKPLELVVSALRAINARPDGTPRLAQALRRLGEPLFEESVPTGYPETEQAWASSGGFLSRMSFATALALGELDGVVVDLPLVLPESDAAGLVAHGHRLFLSNGGSEQTLAAITHQVGQELEPNTRRALTATLFLGSPEFQRQ